MMTWRRWLQPCGASMPEIAVYTAVFGGYDTVRPPTVPVASWAVFSGDSDNPRLDARYHKTLAHRLFPDAEYTIWLDGNVQLLIEPEWLVDEWLGEADVATTVHPSRDCIYDEARACIRKGKDGADVINRQMAAYREHGYPAHNGLAETRVVVRRNTHDVAMFNEMWWSHIAYYSVRDQLSFNWAVWQSGVVWNGVTAWVPRHPWFRYRNHGN